MAARTLLTRDHFFTEKSDSNNFAKLCIMVEDDMRSESLKCQILRDQEIAELVHDSMISIQKMIYRSGDESMMELSDKLEELVKEYD